VAVKNLMQCACGAAPGTSETSQQSKWAAGKETCLTRLEEEEISSTGE